MMATPMVPSTERANWLSDVVTPIIEWGTAFCVARTSVGNERPSPSPTMDIETIPCNCDDEEVIHDSATRPQVAQISPPTVIHLYLPVREMSYPLLCCRRPSQWSSA